MEFDIDIEESDDGFQEESDDFEEESDDSFEVESDDGFEEQIQPAENSIQCHSIRIGSCRIWPDNKEPYFPVNFSEETISFYVRVTDDINLFTLTSQDITRVLVHLGRGLPLMFIYTTAGFGEHIRAILNINESVFNPESRNTRIQVITFLINFITRRQCRFLRNSFPFGEKMEEIDHEEANKILMRSTSFM